MLSAAFVITAFWWRVKFIGDVPWKKRKMKSFARTGKPFGKRKKVMPKWHIKAFCGLAPCDFVTPQGFFVCFPAGNFLSGVLVYNTGVS